MNDKPESLWDYLGPQWDTFVKAISTANFDTLVRNPYFLGISLAFVILCFFKKWRFPLIAYLGGLGIWAIVHYTVGQNLPGQAGFVAIGIIVVAFVAVYFLFIKED